MSAEPEYLTVGEFTRWRAEEVEFRKGVKADLGEIIGLVRAQNGRVAASEATIRVIQRDIEAIKSEDGAIQTVVEDIQKNGCHQYANHQGAIELLEGSGALPNADVVATGPRARWPRISDLSTRQKAVAGVGVTALLIPAISDLLQLIKTIVAWLISIHGGG